MIKPNYKNNILNISNSILRHYNVKTMYDGHHLLDLYLKNNYKHVMLILLDGLGINILNKHLDKSSLLLKHLKTSIDSVFPPTTVAATNAVLSGLPPIVSGYVGWMQYNSFVNLNEVVFQYKEYYTDNPILSNNLKDNHLKYKDIVDQIKEQNNNLNVNKLFPSFDKENGYNSFDDQVDKLIEISKGDKSFLYCYFDEPDATLHKYGIDDIYSKNMVLKLNEQYERLNNNIEDDTLIILIADHGFSDVLPIDLLEYHDIMNLLVRKPSLESRALTFFVRENEKEKFKALFNKYFQKDFLLLSKKEFIESKLLGFGEKHHLIDDFIGDFIALAINNKYFRLKEGTNFKGHHAGLTEREIKVPLIINK